MIGANTSKVLVVFILTTLWVFPFQVRGALVELPEVKGLVVDGELQDWTTAPVETLGVGTLGEQNGAALVRAGWNSSGIYVAIQTMAAQKSHAGDNQSIDLFLDTRSGAGPFDKYVPGVHHFRVRNVRTSVPPIIEEFDGKGAKLRALGESSSVACKILEDGSTVEIFISAEALPDWNGHVSDVIGFAVQQTVRSPSRGRVWAWRTIPLGDERNLPEETPVVFAAARLSRAAPPSSQAYFSAEEVVLGGEPWLEAKLVLPAHDGSTSSRWSIECPELATKEALALVRSPSGLFNIANWRIRLDNMISEAPSVQVILRDSSGKQDRICSIATPVHKQFVAIEKALRLSDFERLDPESRQVVEVLKTAARDSVRRIAQNGPCFRPCRIVTSPTFIEECQNDCSFYLSLARQVLDGQQNARSLQLHGWQSAVDGAHLPIKIALPTNYIDGKKYPARLVVEGLIRNNDVARFIKEDLKSASRGLPTTYQEDDRINIVLFGRGNGYTTVGRDELEEVFTLLTQLPVDRGQIGILGNSNGGADALEIALRHPDLFQWLQCRSGMFDKFLERLGDRTRPVISNFAGKGVYLEAGEKDPLVSRHNSYLARVFSECGLNCVYREREGVGHYFTAGAIPPELTKMSERSQTPKWTYTCVDLWENRAYGLRVARIGDRAREAGFSLEARGPEVRVQTNNVQSFAIERDRLEKGATSLIVDGETIPLPSPFPAAVCLERTVRGWRTARADGGDGERLDYSPVYAAVASHFKIVYGTQTSNETPYLKERAFAVAKALSGSYNEDQCSDAVFDIIRDVDVSEDALSQSNLWLIGNSKQNRVVAILLGRSAPLRKVQTALAHMILDQPALSGFACHSPIPDRIVYLEAASTPEQYASTEVPDMRSEYFIERHSNDGTATITNGIFHEE